MSISGIGSSVSASQDGSEGSAEASAAPAGTSASSSTSEDDEDYDEYDLNQDGAVSLDELHQAYLNGDLSLESLFAMIGGENEGGMSSMMRMGLRAYQDQDAEALAALPHRSLNTTQ